MLETIPFERNSDDFVFDTQFLVQAVHFGFRLGDMPVPVRYFDEASSINFKRSDDLRLADARHHGPLLAASMLAVAIKAFLQKNITTKAQRSHKGAQNGSVFFVALCVIFVP